MITAMPHLRAALAAVILTCAIAVPPAGVAARNQALVLDTDPSGLQDPVRDTLARDAETRRQRIERRTVDAVTVGNDRSERQHAWEGEGTSAGDFGGRTFRMAGPGGWFSYELEVDDKPLKVVCTWRAAEGNQAVFDVIVDGRKIAIESMTHQSTGTVDTEYLLPEELTRNKSSVTVKFVAQSSVGALLAVRTVWADLQE